MLPIKERIDRYEGLSQRPKKRISCRDRWLKKYYNLSLLEWIAKPISPVQSDYTDESDNESSPSNSSSQNLRAENELESVHLAEELDDFQLAAPSIHLLTETVLPQLESNNGPLILSGEESVDQPSSHYSSNMIQSVQESQLGVNAENLKAPFTPITVEERLAGTDEVHTTVVNTCGMTSLPYTLHDDDPFDTKYPNLHTQLPPVSTFLNFPPKKQS